MTRRLCCVPIQAGKRLTGAALKSLLIVYHSQSGSCARLACAARRGAIREASLQITLLRAWDAGARQMAGADGLLLVAAENSGTLSGAMKDFLDRTLYPSIKRDLVIPYALLISAGNDGRGACAQAERIAAGYPLVRAAEPVIVRGEYSSAQAQAATELGEAFGTGLSMGIF
ncbi:MAG: NAD(P)H-dependent oxidoreductase [Halieaceae bacterium]|nr:NAD(P)H-dependent oxidoreductase [Halieaceae bacterium]